MERELALGVVKSENQERLADRLVELHELIAHLQDKARKLEKYTEHKAGCNQRRMNEYGQLGHACDCGLDEVRQM